MDKARYKDTEEDILAVDLFDYCIKGSTPKGIAQRVKEEKARGFICLGCDCKYIAVAIEPGKKRSPHFREKGTHKFTCKVDGYEQLVKVVPKDQCLKMARSLNATQVS